MTKYTQVLLRQKTKMTKQKKSNYKCDKIWKERIQIDQNKKRQIINVTKYKTTEHKCVKSKYKKIKYKWDKVKKDNIQMLRNTKQQNENKNT